MDDREADPTESPSVSLARLDDVQSEEQIALRRLDNAQKLVHGVLEECELNIARSQHYLRILRMLPGRDGEHEDIARGLFSRLDALTRYLTSRVRVAFSMRELLLEPTPRQSNDAELIRRRLNLENLLKAVHDVNNMLTAVLGPLDLAANNVDINENLSTMNTALTRIEGILIGTKKETERKSQNLGEALSVLEGEKGGLEISFQADIRESERSAEVDMSAIELGRLVFNLLDNAKKVGATAAKINVFFSDGMLVIWVKDNGSGFKGIAPLEASRLSREADSAHGNGIGICDELCRNAGGTLTLLNKDDSTGAEFLISLPVREASQH